MTLGALRFVELNAVPSHEHMTLLLALTNSLMTGLPNATRARGEADSGSPSGVAGED